MRHRRTPRRPGPGTGLEPAISRNIIAAYAVNDAAVDPFKLSLDAHGPSPGNWGPAASAPHPGFRFRPAAVPNHVRGTAATREPAKNGAWPRMSSSTPPAHGPDRWPALAGSARSAALFQGQPAGHPNPPGPSRPQPAAQGHRCRHPGAGRHRVHLGTTSVAWHRRTRFTRKSTRSTTSSRRAPPWCRCWPAYATSAPTAA